MTPPMPELRVQWRYVTGYWGRYMVSTDGRVKSLVRHIYLKQKEKKGGYLSVGLRRRGERQRMFMVHRLVLLAFAGPCPSGFEARHINGIPDDNRLSNLAWSTHSENCRDKDIHGTSQVGERNGLSKLTADQVLMARELNSGGVSLAELGRRYGVSWQTIQAIVRRRTWKHI